MDKIRKTTPPNPILRPRLATLCVGLAVGAIALSSLAVFAAPPANRSAYKYLHVFQEVLGLTRQSYVEPVDDRALMEGAYRGMLSSVDIASAYLGPEERAMVESPPGSAGAGFQVIATGAAPVVVRVDDGGPAAEAGMHAGDQLWRINGISARQISWPILTRMLRGETGAKLELNVLDSRTYKLRDVTLTLVEPADHGFRIESLKDAIHLRIRDLERLSPMHLTQKLGDAVKAKPGAPLLVDVRGLIGVDPFELSKLSGVLLPGGDVVMLRRRDGESTKVVSAPAPAPELPTLYILVDGSTAGTGEALAALLKETASGIICGRPSFGLAGVPELIELSRGGGSVMLTTREMRSPGGLTWSKDGLTPDHGLEPKALIANGDDEDQENDRLLEAALEWIAAGAAVAKPAA